MRLVVLLLGAALLLTGCGTEFVAGDTTQPRATFTPDEQLDPPAPAPDPTAITIPKIGAHSSLIPLGLTPEGALEAPPVDTPEQASWYAGAKPLEDGDEHKPGDVGPAIIAGHVDGTGPDGQHGYPGVFSRLAELTAGDEVLVDRADGSQLRFLVTAVEQVRKDNFPTQAVYGATDGPELRLITCGGAFDPAARHYVNNVVVFAQLAP